MLRPCLFTIVAALALPPAAHAQTAWQFGWQKDQTLTYKVKHTTAVTEIVNQSKSEITSKLEITKRWRVLDIDAQGVATLEQSLASLRNEQTRPGGEVLLFDSNDLDKSTPELKGMMKFINVAVAVIRVDRLGRVVEVKQGPKTKFDSEPPFTIVLPGAPVGEGQAWVRPFTISLDPPLGTGEKYPAEQKVACVKAADGKAMLTIITALKTQPESAQERVPLAQKEMQGQLIFDTEKGLVEAVQLTIDRTVENHQGKGSSYRFASSYTETLTTPATIVPTGGTK